MFICSQVCRLLWDSGIQQGYLPMEMPRSFGGEKPFKVLTFLGSFTRQDISLSNLLTSRHQSITFATCDVTPTVVGVLSSPRGGDQARPCGHVGLQGDPGVYHISHMTDRILYRISQTTIHRSIHLSILLYLSIYQSIYPSIFHSKTCSNKNSSVFFFWGVPKISGLHKMISKFPKIPCFSPITKAFFSKALVYIVQQFVQFPGLAGKTKVEIPKLQERNTNKDGWETPNCIAIAIKFPKEM